MFLHRIFIENPDNPNFEPNDPDYVSLSLYVFTDRKIVTMIISLLPLLRKLTWTILRKLLTLTIVIIPNAVNMV